MPVPSVLSVGIPTYNQGSYIAETIESLLSQSEAPAELVVCDNLSTDDTPQVLASFGERIRVIRPPAHLSMMANWNHLVGRLRGEWVALLSSDDIALPTYVEALSRGARSDPAAVVVRGNDQIIDGEGALVSTRRRRPLLTSRPPRNFLERLYSARMNFNAVAFRRTAWERAGGFPEEFRLLGDWAMWIRLCPHGNFVTVPEYITRYRKGHRTVDEDRARIDLWARDLSHLYREVMPAIAAELGGIRPAIVRHAMRFNCEKFLERVSRMVPPGERAAHSGSLAEWARECEVERAFARFRADGKLAKPRHRALKRLAASLGLGR